MEVVDQSLRAAVQALEKRAIDVAAATFRAAMGKLARLFPARSGSREPSPAVRARFEATSSYGTLCALLRECNDLRRACSSRDGVHDDVKLQRLCLCWACILRLSKAPDDTTMFALQAMANFFTSGKNIGGWPSAQKVAQMLLSRCQHMLSAEQVAQVEYVQQVTTHASAVRGASSALRASACGFCPRCSTPLDPLAPACGTCTAQVAVCFRDLKLCELRSASICTICCATFSPQTSIAPLRRQGGASQPVHAGTCAMCSVGELQQQNGKPGQHSLSF